MALDQRIVNALQWALLEHIREVKYQLKNTSTEQILLKLPITYGNLVFRAQIELPARGIGKHLTEIGDRCVENGNPRLDHLVVTAKTRRPAKALPESEFVDTVLSCFNCETFQT